MTIKILKKNIDNIDIYLLDQILKERYLLGEKILDAGCGTGRNLKWFYINGYNVYGIDKSEEVIGNIKKVYSNLSNNFKVSTLKNILYEDESFEHIICNAVLHFAENSDHFNIMFSELIRVLAPNGTLFIRITSDFGLQNKIKHIAPGIYELPDNTKRFLLTKPILTSLIQTYNLKYLEPIKTTNVNDLRCMTTLVFQK